jgi:hypothetical protein
LLETVTLLLLALVLVTKYMTSVHMRRIRLTQVELENLCQRHRRDYDQLFRDRQTGEGIVEKLKQERSQLEAQLAQKREAVDEQNELNREMADEDE